MSRYWSKSWK